MGGGRDASGAALYKRVGDRYTRIAPYKNNNTKDAERESLENDAKKLREFWATWDYGIVPKKALTNLLEKSGLTYDDYSKARRNNQIPEMLQDMEKKLNVNLDSSYHMKLKNDEIQEQKQMVQSAVKDAIEASEEMRWEQEHPFRGSGTAIYRFGEARGKILNYAYKQSPEFEKFFKSLSSSSSRQQKIEAKNQLEKILGAELPDSFFGL